MIAAQTIQNDSGSSALAQPSLRRAPSPVPSHEIVRKRPERDECRAPRGQRKVTQSDDEDRSATAEWLGFHASQRSADLEMLTFGIGDPRQVARGATTFIQLVISIGGLSAILMS